MSENREKTGTRKIGLTLSTESLVRNILLFGFLVLLLLIGGIGYWSIDSINRVREDVGDLPQNEAYHLRHALKI